MKTIRFKKDQGFKVGQTSIDSLGVLGSKVVKLLAVTNYEPFPFVGIAPNRLDSNNYNSDSKLATVNDLEGLLDVI